MIRPNPIRQVYVAEKASTNLVIATHRHPHPPLQGTTERQIGNDFFNNLLVDRTQPLDKDVVHAPALAIHAARDAMPLQDAGEVVTGEQAALIGIENRWVTIARERFLERLDAKIGIERVGKSAKPAPRGSPNP
jgi:hypothetical protein